MKIYSFLCRRWSFVGHYVCLGYDSFLCLMDVFFYHATVTDIPLYNCSAVLQEERVRLSAIQHPLRGVVVFVVAFPMLLIYIACLRVMVELALIQKACYKIMFFLGLYEIAAVLVNDILIVYFMIFGSGFCDAPNTFYAIGCLQGAIWAGASYFCLYLAFNRIIEVLKSSKEVIDSLFSPIRTAIGLLIGNLYTLSFVLFSTPAIFTNELVTNVPSPLGFEMPASSKLRHVLMTAENCGFIIITGFLYGIFCLLLWKRYKNLSLPLSTIRLKNQVFVQSALLCAFNLSISIFYTIFMFFGENVIFPQIGFIVYQFTTGLQALIYLLFNQTILEGVKNNLIHRPSTKQGLTSDLKSKSTTRSTMRTKTGVTILVASAHVHLLCERSRCRVREKPAAINAYHDMMGSRTTSYIITSS